MEPLRLGVIGCGVIGPTHLQGAQESPLIEITAVADLIEERASGAAERFGARKVYREGDDLIEDPDIEAVALALPACGRTRLALHAFEKGKHVLTEKPVATNAAEVERMIAARGSLVAACCSSRYRFTPSARAVTDFIASGEMGPIRIMHSRAISPVGKAPESIPPTWRLRKKENGGGILMNWGCYDLDYLLGITGWTLKPKTVFGQTWRAAPQFASYIVPDSDAETYAAALVRCEGGTVLTYERGEYVPARGQSAWQIVAEKGTLQLFMTVTEGKKIVYDTSSPADGVISRTIWEGAEDGGPILAGPVQDFAAAIREGSQPQTTLENALIIQKITDAVYASAERGSAVEIG
ncbi:MAG: Gfo/Idh/MocA family oxidoreductase [Armatimonadetes bacterium]|nr:Gfo/Idh/MocA family oxidoreductase [Armatimonadota bacterium]